MQLIFPLTKINYKKVKTCSVMLMTISGARQKAAQIQSDVFRTTPVNHQEHCPHTSNPAKTTFLPEELSN